MPKEGLMSIDEMENLFGNQLPIEQLIFLEIRDCDVTAGTPLYIQKVEILRRTIESHHKNNDDKIYLNEIKEAVKKIPDPKKILYNARCTPWDRIPIDFKETIDYEKIDRACRNFLSRHNITFKEERTSIL